MEAFSAGFKSEKRNRNSVSPESPTIYGRWRDRLAIHASGNNMVPRAGLEPARHSASDFKSLVSTNFTTGAFFQADAPMMHQFF
jgi:hypothetical protein